MGKILILFSVFAPVVLGLGSYWLHFQTNKARNTFHIAVISVSAIAVWAAVLLGGAQDITLMVFKKGLTFSLHPDGAGKIFACMSATMWVITSVYATDYMSHEKHLDSFWAFFTASFGVTMGISMAANILTMYLFYEMLTICTIPLVMHSRRPKIDAKAARKYMIYSFGGAALALSCVAYLILNDSNDFVMGGALKIANGQMNIALILFLFAFFGFGVKAAILPLHSWLPAASVAPTPVTALLHSVAVVKAGAFAVIRLIYYSFGAGFLQGTWAQTVAMSFAMATILYGSVQALRQHHFKRRLAFSTVSNLSYIVFAATLCTTAGLTASFTHLVVHSVTKIVAFFAAGAVLHYTGREYLEDLRGMGKQMPVTYACFTVAALSLTGIPGFGGFVSKWQIATAAAETNTVLGYVGIGVLLISALLTAIYMFSVFVRAYFVKETVEVHEASARMTVPMAICCVLMVAIGVCAGPFVQMIKGVLGL